MSDSNFKEKLKFTFWILTLVSGFAMPFLGLLYFPEILTIPLNWNYYVIAVVGVIVVYIITVYFAIKGRKILKLKPLSLQFSNKKFKVVYLLIGIIFISGGLYLSGTVIYNEIDIRQNAYNPTGVYISTPKVGAPIFQEPGSMFTCEITEGVFSSTDTITAILFRGLEKIILTSKRIGDGSVNLTIPSSCPEGLFNLNLLWAGNNLTEVYSVRIWDPSTKAFDRSFRVAHITDPHIAPEKYPQFSEYLKHQIETLGLLHPDLVIMTGDLTDLGDISGYEALQNLILQFGNYSIPVFMVLGNHDLKGQKYGNLEFWERNFAPTHFYRDIPGEDLRFLIFNTGYRDEEFAFSTEKSFIIQGLKSRASNQEVVIACHIPPYRYCDWAANDNQEAEFNDLCDLYDVHAVLAGHSHSDRIVARRSVTSTANAGDCCEDYPILTAPFNETAYIESKGKTNGPAFRWINFDSGKITNCTYDADEDGKLDQKSSVVIKNKDFGDFWLTESSVGNWKTQIINPLNVYMKSAQVSAFLPNAHQIQNIVVTVQEIANNTVTKTYNGNLFQSYDSTNGLRLDLTMDFSANSLFNVSCSFNVVV
jgi:Icc-related predicted phosphoesterase